MSEATRGKPSVAFIGAGKMGVPMIEHLLRAGYGVVAVDPLASNLAIASATGARVVGDIAAALRDADVALSSLPNDGALAAVAREVAASGRRGLIYADTSTVSPGVSAVAAALLEAAGIAYVRTSVSGNPVVARTAGLTVMASGPRAAYDFVKPLLDTFGKTHFYLGQAEEARTMKLVINLMVAGTAGLMAEALVLGEKGGLDWSQMLDVVNGSAVASPMVGYKVPPLKARDYGSTFSGHQMIKDLDLILGEGARSGVPLGLTAQIRQLYGAIVAQGDGDLDYISTVRLLERLSGIAPNEGQP